MKYSVRGEVHLGKEEDILRLASSLFLWKLNSKREENNRKFVFELWVDTEEEKDIMFNNLKSILTEADEIIDWHECTHDEKVTLPCVIREEYRGG